MYKVASRSKETMVPLPLGYHCLWPRSKVPSAKPVTLNPTLDCTEGILEGTGGAPRSREGREGSIPSKCILRLQVWNSILAPKTLNLTF